MRSMLNSLSTVEIVLIFIVGSVVLAIAIAVAIRRLVPDIAERQFEEMAGGLRVVYELLFGLILAFVIASVLDKFNDAQNTVDTEATALTQMHRDNLAFPSRFQEEFDSAIGAHIEAVTVDEWKTMTRGTPSPEAAATLETLYALYASYDPRDGSPTQFYEQALAHLDEAATARRERLSLSTAKLPTVLVIMLPIGVILLLILEYRPGLKPRRQAAFMGTLALVLSSTYLLTIVLDYPFSGDVSVSNEPLQSGTLGSLVTQPVRERKGDRQLTLTAQALDGVWSSEAYGTVVLRNERGLVRGVYRTGVGTVRGRVTGGAFRGVWCEDTRRPEPEGDAGLVQWELVETKDDERIITGTWRSGYDRRADGRFTAAGSWDLTRLEHDTAPDLMRRLDKDPPSRYCRAP